MTSQMNLIEDEKVEGEVKVNWRNVEPDATAQTAAVSQRASTQNFEIERDTFPSEGAHEQVFTLTEAEDALRLFAPFYEEDETFSDETQIGKQTWGAIREKAMKPFFEDDLLFVSYHAISDLTFIFRVHSIKRTVNSSSA